MRIQRSFHLNSKEVEPKWYLIDASNQVVGRLATKVADLLRGKTSPRYTPQSDSGDFVIVINCEKVKFTGTKWDDKVYFWHSNHIGGIKKRSAKEQLAKHPELIIMDAVKGMLPKNSQGKKQITKLKVYVGKDHPHKAQKAEVYEIK